MARDARQTLAAMLAGLLLLNPGGTVPSAQSPTSQQTALLRLVTRPIPLRTGLGLAHEVVTTKSERAQRYYDQGLACLHAFAWIDAARSFNESLRADPALAMGQLGLSYALAELGLSGEAQRASQQATALAAPTTARERLRIEVRAEQLVAAANPGDSAARGRYRAALDRAGRDFPRDPEWLLLIGRAQENTDGDHGTGMHGGSRSLTYYERAQQLAPDYVAIDHYLAHAYENLGKPEAALPHAQRFAAQASQVPHARHMYGHGLRQVDRIREALAEFVAADRLHVNAEKTDGIPTALDWHYRHNLDLLAGVYQYIGQMSNAEAVLRRAFPIDAVGPLAAEQDVHKRAWPLFLLGRQRPAEALAAARAMQAHASPVVQALGHILASRALQASGSLDAAAVEGNSALRMMRALGAAGGTLVPDFEVAQGLYLLRGGDTPRGAAMLRAGATKLIADHRPDVWMATVFELESAARAARELRQPALAGELAEMLRRQAPFYAGTHYVLGLVADDRGDRVTARAAFSEAAARWRDADSDLREVADVRTRVVPKPGAPPR